MYDGYHEGVMIEKTLFFSIILPLGRKLRCFVLFISVIIFIFSIVRWGSRQWGVSPIKAAFEALPQGLLLRCELENNFTGALGT